MDNLERLNNAHDPHAPKGSVFQRLNSHFQQEISTSWLDAVFLLSCFVTGLLDSAVFNVWSCFVSMQTGNTIYAGLGVFGQPTAQPTRWIKSITSIASFATGSLVWSRYLSHLRPLARSTLISIFALQALLILIPACLSNLAIVPPDAGSELPQNLIVLVPLALLSFGQAAHIVLSKTLGYPEITAVVITSAYADYFMSDKLGRGVKNWRRVGSAVLLFLGAVGGSWMTKDGDIGGALWIACGLKVGIALGFVGWKGAEGVRLE